MKELKLYLVTDSSHYEESEFLVAIEEALKGGVTLVQLREKNRTSREFFSLAQKVKKITMAYGISLIINDRLDIAMAVDADGVHLGQGDLPIKEARRLWSKDKIIGATTKTLEQALEAEKQGADYLGVGAIYPTTTKVITKITKVSTLDEIISQVAIPVIAIGGLNSENIHVLSESKIHGIAVVSGILGQPDQRKAAENLIKSIDEKLTLQ